MENLKGLPNALRLLIQWVVVLAFSLRLAIAGKVPKRVMTMEQMNLNIRFQSTTEMTTLFCARGSESRMLPTRHNALIRKAPHFLDGVIDTSRLLVPSDDLNLAPASSLEI
jgi:hypothetical protein